MERILKNLEIPYKVGVGEAAFYGPKLDIQIKNVWGKEDTLITIQIDQMLAEKFGMVYTDKDGIKKNPYIIHRTSIGCYERTLAYLIEKFAGAFPTWLSPTQVKIVTVSDNNNEYAEKIKQTLSMEGIRVELDLDNESVGKKIRNAVLEKIPYILVLGDKEMAENSVAVRLRGSQDTVSMSIEEFKSKILENIKSKSLTL